MKPVEFILGKRPEHAHEDAGCFSVCPVRDYDLKSLKIEFELVTVRIDELQRAANNPTKQGRMARLVRKQATIDARIKEMS